MLYNLVVVGCEHYQEAHHVARRNPQDAKLDVTAVYKVGKPPHRALNSQRPASGQDISQTKKSQNKYGLLLVLFNVMGNYWQPQLSFWDSGGEHA